MLKKIIIIILIGAGAFMAAISLAPILKCDSLAVGGQWFANHVLKFGIGAALMVIGISIPIVEILYERYFAYDLSDKKASNHR